MVVNNSPNWTRRVLSFLSLMSGILAWALLLIQGGRGVLSQEFLILYGLIGTFGVVLGTVSFIVDFARKYVKPESLLGRAFFIFESSTFRPLSKYLAIPLFLTAVLSLALIFLVATNTASFSIPNPYTQSMVLSQETLSQYSATSNFLNIGVIVPILEELLVFFGWQTTTFLLIGLLWLMTGRRDGLATHPVTYWLVATFSIVLWAVLFALGHGRYGGDAGAYAFAMSFQVVAQMLNALTGAFVSPILHIVHNTTGIATQQFSFIASMILFVPKKALEVLSFEKK